MYSFYASSFHIGAQEYDTQWGTVSRKNVSIATGWETLLYSIFFTFPPAPGEKRQHRMSCVEGLTPKLRFWAMQFLDDPVEGCSLFQAADMCTQHQNKLHKKFGTFTLSKL